MTPMKSVYFDVKRLLQDSEIYFPCEINVGVFHHDTTGDCKYHQKKMPLVSSDDWIVEHESKWESLEVLMQSILHISNFLP